MTRKQLALYKVIKEYIEAYEMSPTIYELATLTDKTPSTISEMVKMLCLKGYVTKDNRKRSIRLTDKEVNI